MMLLSKPDCESTLAEQTQSPMNYGRQRFQQSQNVRVFAIARNLSLLYANFNLENMTILRGASSQAT